MSLYEDTNFAFRNHHEAYSMPASFSSFSQGDLLSILTHAPASAVIDLAEALLPQLESVVVLENRTGLIMLPYTDTAQGTLFHLGEIQVAEARVRVGASVEGYGMVAGRDLLFALAVAVLDAAVTANQVPTVIAEIYAFATEQHALQTAADEDLLRQVGATRVEMETFQ